MAKPGEPNNTYTPAILIIAFVFVSTLALTALVLTSRKNTPVLGTNAETSPSPTPVLNIGDPSATLPPVQKIPLEKEETRKDASLDLDPDLTTKETSIPSVLKDKKIQIPLQKN